MNFTKLMYVLGFISLVLAPFTGITIVGAAAFFIIGYISEKREKHQDAELFKELHIENDGYKNSGRSRNEKNFSAPLDPVLSADENIPTSSFISEDRIIFRKATKKILDQAESGLKKIYRDLKVDGKFHSNSVNLFLISAETMPYYEDGIDKEEMKLFVSIYHKAFGFKSTFSEFEDGEIWYSDKVNSLFSDKKFFFLFFILLGRLEGVAHLICDSSDISEDLAEADIRKIMISLGETLENMKTNGSELEIYFAKDLIVQSYEILVEKFKSKGFYRCASLLTG